MEEDNDDNNTNINRQPNNEGEKVKGGWALCNLFFFNLFCDGFFFFLLCFYQAQKKFFIIKNLVITYKLSTIKGLYHKVNDFVNISFSWFLS
jgi:hypothetical protein